MRWQNRAHFFAVSAQVMRRVLVDYARRENLKRGAGVPHLSLDDGAPLAPEPLHRILALHDALDALATLDPRKARIVEMRFFGGLTAKEVAEVLDVSVVTVMRDWSSAKAWLYRELGEAANGS
jgi:RNA polymerase sigma factor (TIGR02999 family)